MWSDNETNRDFLNFRAVANTVAETIVLANGRPLSLGVCGSWGVGKSSMIKLIEEELAARKDQKFVFVEFNAWLYQGYDDARAALMEVIANSLLKYAEENKKPTERILEFLGRVRWARVASLGAGVAASVAIGMPLPGVVGSVVGAFHELAQKGFNPDTLTSATEAGKAAVETGKELLAEKTKPSPPKEIQELRNHFEAILKDIEATLVVFIDDLDRCLPTTAIATLEAIRLFLFLNNAAFVVAADDKMIRQAVKVHFKDVELDDDLVTNYFDKLIQVPIRVPPLGTQDVRAYLFLLFIENSSLSEATRDELRLAICKQLSQTWQGKRVDRSFVMGLIKNCPDVLASHIELADRLAPIMTSSEKIAGNPRLIKRFLNTLSIRLSIARGQGVTIDEAALAKMLLFERCGPPSAYTELITSINAHEEGRPLFLKPWEELASKGKEITGLTGAWETSFAKEWLGIAPAFADQDLRAVVYVSREHMPIITPADGLSSEGQALLEALLLVKGQPSDPLARKLKAQPTREVSQIMERILARAKTVQEWGTPPILYAALTVATVEPSHADTLARFLKQIPAAQIRASIIPLLADRPWAQPVLTHWAAQSGVLGPVKKAISNTQNRI